MFECKRHKYVAFIVEKYEVNGMATIVEKYEVKGSAGTAAFNDDESFTVNADTVLQNFNNQIGST